MAYVKNIWIDQDVERPKTYEVTNNQDGSITLTDSFGLVTELGTPVNETNMNHIEEGIDGCAIRKHNLTETFNLDEWVLGGSGATKGIYKSLVASNVGNAITDTTKWEKVQMGGGGHLFDFKWSDHLLDDIDWLRADTFSWQDGTVYSNCYNALEDDLTGITSETETISGYTVTFYRAANGRKICLANQESTVLNIYNATGIAWYYILDTDNTRFKLPRTKYGFEGLRGNVGDKIDESLPNITGTFSDAGLEPAASLGTSGALYRERNYSGNYYYHAGQQGAGQIYLDFDASRSSSTYQNNAPVQERATQMYLYFYVGGFSQTATEQTAGLNSELLNGKADVDLSNVPASKGILTESYVNGTSWYRIYSDGWCEQGGFVGNITPNTWIFVNLLKPYKDNNYTVIGSGVDPSISPNTPDQFFSYRSPLQTTGFYGGIRYLSGGAAYTDRGFSWKAEGFIR